MQNDRSSTGSMDSHLSSRSTEAIAANDMMFPSRTRAKRAGDAFEIERKLEKKYELEEELGTVKAIINWVNVVLESEVAPLTDMFWRSVQNHLRDGTVICRLMNHLLLDAGLPKLHFRTKAKSAFIAMNNIEDFNKAAFEYGVPEPSLFQSADLFETRKGPFVNIIMCLYQLGMVANSRGFEPSFKGIPPPKVDFS